MIETIADGYLVRTHPDGTVEQLWIGVDPVERPTLSIDLAQSVVPAGTPVDWTAQALLADGSFAPITGTYYVPVVRRTDGVQARLITVQMAGGQAAGQVTLGEPGIYLVRFDDAEPAPSSKLAANPLLIVTET